MEIIRRGREATLIAVGPMLAPTLEVTADLDVTILLRDDRAAIRRGNPPA
jgi:hypothetical protein